MLGRGEGAAALVDSLASATGVPYRLLFLCSEGDNATHDACVATGADVDIVPFPLAGGDYARKINHGIATTAEEWVLQAAVDIRFHAGWAEAALAKAAEHIGVVGTNDMGNPLVKAGRHATHSLIRRAYVEEFGTIDERGKALHEGYHHCWVDNELVETAIARRAWAAARRSRVEHLHYVWRKSADDATYRRGQSNYHEDRVLFGERRPLWRNQRSSIRQN